MMAFSSRKLAQMPEPASTHLNLAVFVIFTCVFIQTFFALEVIILNSCHVLEKQKKDKNSFLCNILFYKACSLGLLHSGYTLSWLYLKLHPHWKQLARPEIKLSQPPCLKCLLMRVKNTFD